MLDTFVRKRIHVHDSNVIPTISGQIYKRTSETMNAEGDGMKRPETTDSDYWLPEQAGGRTGQWNMSEDTNGPPFVRCRLFYPSSANPSPPGRAAGHSPFLSSVQFKGNACHGHVPIHSDLPRVDTRYLCIWPVHEICISTFFKCDIFTRDIT